MNNCERYHTVADKLQAASRSVWLAKEALLEFGGHDYCQEGAGAVLTLIKLEASLLRRANRIRRRVGVRKKSEKSA